MPTKSTILSTLSTATYSLLNDYFRDLIGLIEHYQTCYPDPEEELQDHIDNLDIAFMTEDAFKLLESLKIGADRIRKIVLSLRNFSRLDEFETKAVNLHEGLDSTLLILQSKIRGNAGDTEIEIIKDYGYLDTVECYPSQLNQAFMNILSNAIDALYDNIEAHPETATVPPRIYIQTELSPDAAAIIQIADNGPGIPEAIRTKLFDPSFTTKPVGKGTGLGLSISHEIIVEKHQGSIAVSLVLVGGLALLLKFRVRRQLERSLLLPIRLGS
ncbi:MAG: ATP-binding protein [Phormidesmis sp.]